MPEGPGEGGGHARRACPRCCGVGGCRALASCLPSFLPTSQLEAGSTLVARFPHIWWQESAVREANEARMEALATAGAAAEPPLAVSGRFAVSVGTQRRWLAWKAVLAYWRTPYYSERPRGQVAATAACP